jgi:hypothetical protein
MRIHGLATACVFLLLVNTASTNGVSDHLLPVKTNEDARYRELLKKLLCPTPFDCGRLIVEPPFQYGEESISVYSKGTEEKDRYCVSYLVASDSLRDVSDDGTNVERAQRVKIARIDAELPPTTAKLTKQVWKRMLFGSQAPRDWQHAPEKYYGDPTIAEFSIQFDSKVIRGQAPMIPELGKKTKAFSQIGELLIGYCKAKADKRETILAEIDAKARQLLSQL